MATYARYGETHNNLFTANLLENLPVKELKDRSSFDRIVAMSLRAVFWSTLYGSNGERESAIVDIRPRPLDPGLGSVLFYYGSVK